eukprot:4889544-Karenia_brevis.AAC.1
MRCAVTIAKERKLTLASVFVDVKTAFATFVRGLALPVDGDASVLCQRLIASGMDNIEALEISRDLCQRLDWSCSESSNHVRELIANMHANSWFTMDLVDGCCATALGSLA